MNWSADTPECRRLSHWRDALNERAWREYGARHEGLAHALADAVGRPWPPGSVVEWGPGGGANAVRFHRSRYNALDVSTANLRETRTRYEAAGGTGWGASAPYDLFIATAVVQHMPDRAHVRDMLRRAYGALDEGGTALVQVRTLPATESFTRRVTFPTAGSFGRECEAAGFAVVFVEPGPIDYLYFGLAR